MDDFVSRFLSGWNRHVALVDQAHAFVLAGRQRRGPTRLRFHQARAETTDILTAYCFVTHRRKVQMLTRLAECLLRIQH